MKRMLIFLLLISLFLAVAPVSAESKKTVGEKIDIMMGAPTEFAANTPFHIDQGWQAWSPDDTPIGIYDFQLDIDGVLQEEDFVARFVDTSEITITHNIDWVFNFPDGLPAETYTFTGHWFAPCRIILELGYIDECPTPNYKVEVYTIPLEVTFYTTP
jgi:hypothetical protein